MIIKVCGLNNAKNYTDIIDIGVAMTGINFYPSSKRYIDQGTLPPKSTEQRVGVYVNATLDYIRSSIEDYNIDLLQLHGDESVNFCRKAQQLKPIIKVWRIGATIAWESMERYAFADYFLFDTKTKGYGGSGHHFDWDVLRGYKMKVPFLLSGGISPDDVDRILNISHKMFGGVDINSRFEVEAGIKNVELVTSFIAALKKGDRCNTK